MESQRSNSDYIKIAAVQPPLRPDETTPMESALIAKNLIIQAYKTEQQKQSQNESEATAFAKANTNLNLPPSIDPTTISDVPPVDLFVLPELSPIGYTQHTFQTYLSNTDPSSSNVLELKQIQGEIQLLFSNLAKELDVYISYGAIGIVGLSSTTSSDDGITKGGDDTPKTKSTKVRFTIRQLVIDPTGKCITHYDKIHLCDYGDCAETNYFTKQNVMTPSSTKTSTVDPNYLCSFPCRSKFRVGILICADIRDPILARRLATPTTTSGDDQTTIPSRNHRVDVIVQPAAFARDVSFRTWKSFRETRAIENSIYWVGVNYGGSYFGESTFVGPWVDETDENETVGLGVEDGVLVGVVRRDLLDRVRKELPFYDRL